jgi:DNA (cytosine-5)-methyltransferase 3A
MKVLSLFDGMACGALALQAAGVEIESYDAFEIDKYAIKTAAHNFPFIKHHGNVFEADFTKFKGVDLVCGGSPCTYWSIAKTSNRETEASGEGWELFQQFVRAIKEVQPKYFIYENNKSMSKAIRASIDDAFGFEAVLINSALVSAQSRQRLYWVGKRNADGTYSKVNVEQPEDRGILLKDVLDGVTDRTKARTVIGSIGRTTEREYFIKAQGTMTFEPVFPLKSEKARCVTAGYANKGAAHILESYYSDNPSKQKWDSVAEPVAIPLNTTPDGKSQTIKAQAQQTNEDNIIVYAGRTFGASGVAEPVRIGTYPNNAKNQDKHDSQQYRIYSTEGKSVALCGNGGGLGAKTGLYAIPVEFDGDIPIKAISGSDGKTYRVHEVKNGLITIKGKEYPINLADGFYIIRKLTVTECKRLQAVPEWYDCPVSDSQAYKMLGNGWTVEVIAHLINSCLSDKGCVQPEIWEQMSFF